MNKYKDTLAAYTMKKAIWIIITLMLSGLIPASVAIVLKYNDLCSAAKKAYLKGDFIQSIESATQASALIPFLPQAGREINRSFSALTNNPARIAASVIANIKDVNVQPLRRFKKELPGELASYCSPEQVKIIYDDVLKQIKEIAERKASAAYDAQNLSDLAVKLSILANVGYGATTQEADAMKQWLNSYAMWVRQEKYLTTHNLITALRSNLPDSFRETSVGELSDNILLICEKKRGIKYSGETAVTQAFQKAGFIVFPEASDKPVATFRLTAPQVKHGEPSHYSSSEYDTTTATRYPATATLSGTIVNSEGRLVKRITVSNMETTPRSLSYYGSSSSSMDRYGKPTQETIDSNAKKGLMQKMEAEIIRQVPGISL
jgi:hypothetical protein